MGEFGTVMLWSLIGASIAVVVALAIKSRKDMRGTTLDERQLQIMGRGSKYAMTMMVLALLVAAFIVDRGGSLPVTPAYLMVAIACLGLGVYVTYGIWQGAYFGTMSISRIKGSLLVFWVLLAACDAIVGGSGTAEDLADGVPLGYDSSMLLLGVLFIYMAVLALIRDARDARELEA
jgi:heme exporter protein D